MRCAVIACRNSHRWRPGRVSFHKFPEDEETQRMWKNAIDRDNMIVTKSSVVCSDHFLMSDMVRYSSRTILRDDAIPSLSPRNDGKPRSSHTVLSTPSFSKVVHIGEFGVDSEFINDGFSEATIQRNNICNVSDVAMPVQSQPMQNPSSMMMFSTITLKEEPESIDYNEEMNFGVTENIFSDDESTQSGQELKVNTASNEIFARFTPPEDEISESTSSLTAEVNQRYSGYIEPQKYLSPYPIWHIQSYTTGKGEISTTSFSSAISRCTQTRKDSESKVDEPKDTSGTDNGKKKQLKKFAKDHAELIGNIEMTHHKLERLKIKITRNEEMFKNLKKAFRRADMRAERLKQQIDDFRSENPQRRPRRKKLKEGTKRKKKAKSSPTSKEVTDQSPMKIKNTILCNENILDISQLAGIADCVEVGQVIQLPILGTNESVNVLVGMPLNNTPNTINNIVTNGARTS